MKPYRYKLLPVSFVLLGIAGCREETHQQRDQRSRTEPHYHAAEQAPLLPADTLNTFPPEQKLEPSHSDHDFLHAMVYQHQVAMNLAQEEINNGQSKKLTHLAKQIYAEHQKEKDFLEGVAKQLDKKDRKEQGHPMLHRELNRALQEMNQKMSLEKNNNPDNKFKSMIIIHHQASIAIAQAYITVGGNKDLLEYAQRLIVEHQEEITALE
ncbi:DUF305 domain-containing protein [Adhaeribacter rhizoryzae]|uniref:DUF305 domain-containing protein n=1 Tax=Adhaeribacter rhizoryzae TaxID=2607907 RepID=A0A5M6D9Y8_9BACT|nr:DUF305 domain-containing protein [Adhaeribacter rhizoryzae]KAA5542015.1 DUF305 domain-containing protein [Adhaeribacter rhizoryzae]